MNGIICIDKPSGFTSFDVVAIMKRVCHTKTIGHGGTLDPMATGVLPLFVGNATRASDIQPDDTKEYTAGFRLGITTDTQDITGTILAENSRKVDSGEFAAAVETFCGDIMQLPPMYSAVKINGQRLYDLARQGREIERVARPITISSLELLSYDINCGELHICCSKGTYVRTLIHDIGQKLGTGAVMTSLCRTRAGVFTLSDCHGLESLRETINHPDGEKEVEKLLLPLDKMYAEYPGVTLDEKQTELFRNGVTLDAQRIPMACSVGIMRIYDCENVFVALAKTGTEDELQIIKRFRKTT